MIKRMILMIAFLAILFGGIFGWKYYEGLMVQRMMASQHRPPVTVSATEAKKEVWQPVLSAVGSLRATQGVNVSTEVAGKVTKISFDSGLDVEKGEVLVQLDDTADRANLHGLQADEDLANIELKRQRRLRRNNVNTQADLDTAEAKFKKAHANVESQEALIAKKKIRAPFSGRLGIRQIDIGEYLSPGAVIVTLQALDPIYVDFSLPQQELGRVRLGQTVKLRVDTYPGAEFQGQITAISPKVTAATRNFPAQASLRNDDLRLRPGMFGETKVLLPEQTAVLTLPQTAVTYNPYGDSVFLVQKGGANANGKPALKAHRVFVETGERRGDQVAILRGVKAGDLVVTSGQLKLNEGTPVRIDNSVVPDNNPSPTPAEN